MSLHKIIKEREEEFLKRFDTSLFDVEYGEEINKANEVKDFNHQTSLAIIDGEIERLEKDKGSYMPMIEQEWRDGFRSALQDQIEYLQAEREKLTLAITL